MTDRSLDAASAVGHGPAAPAAAASSPVASAPAEPITMPLPVADPAETADWVVLARPRAERPAEEPASLRRVLFPVALAALVVAVIVAIGGSVVSQRIAESEAVHDVAVLTDDLADSVIQPALTNAMPGDPAQARRVLDPLVHPWLQNGSMVRVKVWTPAGMVLYSDEPRLIGETFALEPGARSALVSPRTDADISDLRLPENRFERGDGKLLEVCHRVRKRGTAQIPHQPRQPGKPAEDRGNVPAPGVTGPAPPAHRGTSSL